MSQSIKYSKEDAPKVGLVSNSIGVFNEKGKKQTEQAWFKLFTEFKQKGIIHQKSIFS